MHRFSIIVPVLGGSTLVDDTLASLLRYRPEESQVIVAHDGSFVDQYGLESEVEFVDCGRAQFGDLLDGALQSATGELIGIIRPGIELDEDWQIAIEEAFADPAVGSVTPLIATTIRPTTIVAAGVATAGGFRRTLCGSKSKIAPRTMKKLKPLGPTSWAAFYHRDALAQLSECLVESTDGEACFGQLESVYIDLEFALGLAALGYRNVVAKDCVVFADRDTLVTKEAETPHGTAAHRALRRYSDANGVTKGLAVVGDLVSGPFFPWRLTQAWGRITGLSKGRTDRKFAQAIQRLASTPVSETESTLPFPAPVTRATQRRAA